MGQTCRGSALRTLHTHDQQHWFWNAADSWGEGVHVGSSSLHLPYAGHLAIAWRQGMGPACICSLSPPCFVSTHTISIPVYG